MCGFKGHGRWDGKPLVDCSRGLTCSAGALGRCGFNLDNRQEGWVLQIATLITDPSRDLAQSRP